MTHPVFLGEWGFGDEHPASERNYGEALVGYCEGLGLGWTAWIWDHGLDAEHVHLPQPRPADPFPGTW